MARSNVATTIERIRRQLNASIRHETNELAVNLDTTTGVVTLEYDLAASIQKGTILSVGRELMRVVSKNESAKEVTVIRGWQDSEGEAHVDGDEVLISPRFTRMDIYDAMIDEITAWAPKLFRVATYEWSIDDETDTVELPALYADALGLISVRRLWDDDAADGASSWPTIGFRLLRGDAAVWSGASTSGLLIRLLPNNGIRRAGAIVSQIAVPFDVTSDELLETEDLIVDYGLEPSMLEVVDLGVKMRIIGDGETGRTQRGAQDEPRRAEEVPAGASLTIAQTIRSNYARRFGDEVAKLQHKYKPRAW